MPGSWCPEDYYEQSCTIYLYHLVGPWGRCFLFSNRKKELLPEAAVRRFRQDARDFAATTVRLQGALRGLEPGDKGTLAPAIAALKASRIAYKKIECLMEYFFKYPVNLYNRAPVYEIEEPYMEFQAPVGLQVIEDLLLDDESFENKEELLRQMEVIRTSAADIPAIMHGFEITDGQIAAAVRLELIRIIALGITGYDAPKLKTGIAESAMALQAVKEILLPVLEGPRTSNADSVLFYLNACIGQLEEPVAFADFDRMAFLVKAALPLQTHLDLLIRSRNWDVADGSILNHNSKNLFDRNAFKLDSFLVHPQDTGRYIVSLGKMLFEEKRLSGNGKRSCATCHRSDKYFTDALPKSIAFDEAGTVARNAPSLFYAALQHGQFLDARAASLEEQIVAVLSNPSEMNADLEKARTGDRG